MVAIAAPLLALGMAAGPRQPRAGGAAAAVIASVVELIVVWGWHTPALHHAARTSTMALAVEQGMFLTSAFYVWYFALRGGRYASNSAAAGIALENGRLEAGCDSDVVVLNPVETWTVETARLLSSAGWSPYQGMTLQGRISHVFVRGRAVVEDGEMVGHAGNGRFLPGAAARSAAAALGT